MTSADRWELEERVAAREAKEAAKVTKPASVASTLQNAYQFADRICGMALSNDVRSNAGDIKRETQAALARAEALEALREAVVQVLDRDSMNYQHLSYLRAALRRVREAK